MLMVYKYRSAPAGTSAAGAGPPTLPRTFVKGFHDEDVVRRMKYRALGNTGMEVSTLSLGCSSIGGVFDDFTDDDEAINVIIQAVKHGINLLDTAPWYGHNKSENLIGKAIKHIPRAAFYINTKVRMGM